MKYFVFSLVFLVFVSCETKSLEERIKEAEKSKINCDLITETLKLKNQTVTLPTTGKFVLESHLLTKDDIKMPQDVRDGVMNHIDRSCELIGGTCSEVYTTKYHFQWTPAESGHIGQGSVGSLRPSVEEEMWSGNMYWTKENKPKPGTKYLAKFKNNSVVVVMGYETGPADPKWLGGFQGEVFYGLGAKFNQDQIYFGRLVDQSHKPGPINCN